MPLECARAYNTDFLSNRSNLFLITKHSSNTTQDNTILDMIRISSNRITPNSWMCGDLHQSDWSSCNTSEPTANLASGLPWWVKLKTGEEVEVVKCRSEITKEKCKVRFSLAIMMVVIWCNLVKACCMVMAVVRSREPTLVTLGDAIDSFLRTPDPTTIGMCFANRQYIGRDWRRRWKARPRQWKQKGVQRWWTSVSKTRWITCNFCFAITIIGSAVLLRSGIRNDGRSVKTDIRSM